MKKLIDNKFLLILSLCIIVLIILGIGAFYLFDDSDDSFVKSGYVLNPLSSKVEKYFFDEGTNYHTNLSSMVEFVDVDDTEIEVLKESFLHYDDGSLSFLTNGAILDLDSVKGNDVVTFYNITNESIINKKDSGYIIENNKGDIKINNFIGRISDNKYIIVGDLSAKIPGNKTNITGDYFEIVYVEDGIVNIENKNVKYQVMAEGTFIYVNNLKIDLGNKMIIKNDENVMSITAITIDGDENIEIVPKASDEEDTKENGGGGGGSGSGSGDGDGTGEGNGDGTGTGEGTGSGTGNGEEGSGNGGTDKSNTDVEYSDDIVISLKDASIGSTNVSVVFDIDNALDTDNFVLKVTNIDTGRTVDMVTNVIADEDIRINLLSPNTKYLFTVINEDDGNKYFQKIFETNDFGISLEKSYATDEAIAYKITVDEGTDINNAKLTLYKYNEETHKNEVVKTSYYDTSSEETVYVEKKVNISSLDENIEGVHEVIFDGLDSDTIYTAVLDEFSVASSNFKDIYNVTLTSMTLKETPSFSDMQVVKNVGDGSFKLSIGNITDNDNAIVGYTYLIYEQSDKTKTVIDPINKSNASPIEVKIGDGENQLKNDTNYFYKVIIEYYDNEKYIEYITADSINFVMGSDPYITVVVEDKDISYDKIAGTIYLTDNSCLISMPGREKCNDVSNAVLDIKKVNSITGEKTSISTKIIDFVIDEDIIKYDFSLDGLQSGTTYEIEVRAFRNDHDKSEREVIEHTEESNKTITTKTLSSFLTEWTKKDSNATHVVNLQTQFVGKDGTGTLSAADTANSIKKVVLKLYQGDYVLDIGSEVPIAVKEINNSDTFNIKENFYDNAYTITSDGTFGLSLSDLKELTDGSLSEYYTIMVQAYYDSDGINEVILENNIVAYQINPLLLLENVEDPEIRINPITKAESVDLFTELSNGGTYVGYSVSAAFDRNGLIINGFSIDKFNLYVYDKVSKQRVKFYILDGDELKLVDSLSAELGETDYFDTEIYMAYGSEYGTVDSVMSRGNSYYISYELTTTKDGVTSMYPNASNEYTSYNETGVFSSVDTEKETPNVKMYISKSTSNSISYKYVITDADHALYKESTDENYNFYYTVDGGVENKVSIANKEDNSYKGTITISNLEMNNIYTLYYKKNITKTGDLTQDVVNYLDSDDNGERLFEGYYDSNDSEYNFKYEVVNSQNDNKVTIKILASEDILKRIIAYQVKFTCDGITESLSKEIWNLTKCPNSDEEEIDRCFSVDYTEFKELGMKSDANNIKNIKVSINALYDTGLSGYDYKIGSEDGSYKYMIFQNNVLADGTGSYISFNGTSLAKWTSESTFVKGYYTYTMTDNGMVTYKSVNKKTNKNFYPSLTSLGYVASGVGVLNPKMISVAKMDANENNDSFSFSSITPKISVSQKTQLINGAVVDLTLSGADLSDFKEEDGEYYLYIDVFDMSNYSARPTIKVKINKDNPNGTLTAVIDGVFEERTYKFKIYGYLNKNNEYVKTQLFDASNVDEYVTKDYEFTSMKANEVLFNFSTSISVNDEVQYGNRDLKANFIMLPYSNYQYNYDLVYIVCDITKDACSFDSEDHYIYKKTITVDDLNESSSTTISDITDISSYNLEFDTTTKYYLYVYAKIGIYNGCYVDGCEMSDRYVELRHSSLKLDALKEPTFVVTRNASVNYIDEDNKDYYIDFVVNATDSDRVLNDGVYHISLLNSDGDIVGNLYELDEDGNYVLLDDYSSHEFDALVKNKKIRIGGLDKDTKYTFVIYNDAYMNNYSSIPVEDRTVQIKKTYTVYTTNDYGVAFGNDVLYSATQKSIVATFLGGSSFDNVMEVQYTIGLWDDEQSTATYSGKYAINEEESEFSEEGLTFKKFEIYKGANDYSLTIDPEGMTNELGQTYTVALSFKVRDSESALGYVTIDKNVIESLNGRVQYRKDEK